MGEKKIGPYLTFKDLIKKYGWSQSFFYKNAAKLEPALLKIGGKAPKPHRFDLNIVERIISADGNSKSEKVVPMRLRRRISAKRKVAVDDSGDSWR